METGARRPDPSKVMACLDALGVDEGGDTWRGLVRVAREANAKGWWDEPEFVNLGDRQKRYADIEAGAKWIGLYHNSLMPGLLQTVDYVRAREEAFRTEGVAIDPVQGVARLRRQSEVIRDGGPHIEVVLEEQVVRRLVTNPEVMAAQLDELNHLARRYPQVSIRILPVDAPFAAGQVPRSPLALHTFADPDDGTAVLLEIVNDDLLVHEPDEVAPYVRLWSRLHDAAMSDADSAAFIAQTASKLGA